MEKYLDSLNLVLLAEKNATVRLNININDGSSLNRKFDLYKIEELREE